MYLDLGIVQSKVTYYFYTGAPQVPFSDALMAKMDKLFNAPLCDRCHDDNNIYAAETKATVVQAGTKASPVPHNN